MKKERQREFERLECLKLKAKLVSYMTENVKLMIALRGFTPTEIATVYIVKQFKYVNNDYLVIDPHTVNLINDHCMPTYKKLVFNDSGTEIIDIIF